MKNFTKIVMAVIVFFSAQGCIQVADVNAQQPQVQNQNVGLVVANMAQVQQQYLGATTGSSVRFVDINNPRDGRVDYNDNTGTTYYVVGMILNGQQLVNVMVSFSVLKALSSNSNIGLTWIGTYSNVPFGANGALSNGTLDINSGAYYYLIK